MRDSLTGDVTSSLACLQVLQYNPSTDVWSQIGKLERGRGFHGVAEVNLAAVGCVGNLHPIKITILTKIISIIITRPTRAGPRWIVDRANFGNEKSHQHLVYSQNQGHQQKQKH